MDNVNIPGVTLSPLSESKLSEDMNGEGVYVTITPRDMDSNKKKKRRSLALSKVFGKSRTRRSIAVCDPSILEGKLNRKKLYNVIVYQRRAWLNWHLFCNFAMSCFP